MGNTMTDNLPPLLPCPFCGGSPRHLEHKAGFYTERAICDSCGFHLPPEGWNRRAALTQAQSCVPAGYVLVPVELLKRAESSLGSFCSDHGWGDADMQTMDDISGLLAASPPPQPVQPTYTENEIADAAMQAEIPDSKLESLLIALAEAPQPKD